GVRLESLNYAGPVRTGPRPPASRDVFGARAYRMEHAGPLTHVVILGSTGSIGRSALSVIEHDGGVRLRAFGLAAHRSVDAILDQARAHRPRYIALTCPEACARVDGQLRGSGVELLSGRD